jgi:hypothetical protein
MNCIKNNIKIFCFKLNYFLFIFSIFSFLSMEANAQGLQRAKGVLETVKGEILTIVPIISIIALIGLGIGYAINSVQKETFMRWGAGLIIVGSAAQITTMLIG